MAGVRKNKVVLTDSDENDQQNKNFFNKGRSKKKNTVALPSSSSKQFKSPLEGKPRKSVEFQEEVKLTADFFKAKECRATTAPIIE